ncbi:MAG TPA: hypothetical protein VHE33_15365 [Acidobacteriaceae bacterium]|nr:hypothetical protein [Acidobacteriaceae bacterium]
MIPLLLRGAGFAVWAAVLALQTDPEADQETEIRLPAATLRVRILL